jgi:hypothetical protein
LAEQAKNEQTTAQAAGGAGAGMRGGVRPICFLRRDPYCGLPLCLLLSACEQRLAGKVGAEQAVDEEEEDDDDDRTPVAPAAKNAFSAFALLGKALREMPARPRMHGGNSVQSLLLAP